MSDMEEVMTACDWCLQEALVQTIDEKLWRFWKIISTEDPIVTSLKNICDRCKSRYQEFSIYIEKCKINTSKVDELLSMGQVKDEPSVDIEYPPLIKEEISDEVDWNSFHPAVSSEGSKEEPLIEIGDRLVNDVDIWKEEASHPGYPTVSGCKGKTELVLSVPPDSIILQKKVNDNLICTYCDKTFNFPCRLKIHLRTHTGNRPFKCVHCDKSFTRSINLKSHLRIHTSDKPYKCSHCIKSFTRMSHLNSHLRTHTGEKPFQCSHCNKSFTLLNYLNCHLRTHTGEKPFKCSHCSKSFTQTNHLNSHLRIHTGEKPFKCSHCNKRFVRLDTLNVHLRTHTGVKPFECSHCNKSFTQLSNLNTHLRVHTGEKPFKCSHCNKAFTRFKSFKYHSRIHTNDK